MGNSIHAVSHKTMIFHTYIDQKAKLIDQHVSEQLRNWREQFADYQEMLPILDTFMKSCEGGKKLRGTLVLLGYELTRGKDYQAILQPAAAWEIFHASILAHDDIIDKSVIRRGRQSLFQALGGNDYGISQAITLGDLGFFFSMQLLAESNFPPFHKNRALSFFSKIVQETAVGQILDIHLPSKKLPTKKDILAVALLKTATYTFVGPLVTGSLLAGSENSDLVAFGQKLGIAYQIQDDILGVFADEKTLGKSNLSDVQEAKATLLIWYARAHAQAQQQKILKQLYGKKNVSESEKKQIEAIFLSTGAYDYAVQTVQKYSQEACLLIGKITTDKKMQNMLSGLVQFLLERKK